LIVGQGLTLSVAGVALGFGTAVDLTSVTKSLSAGIGLFQASATDVSTHASVALLLILVALAAGCIPAGRAIRTGPTSTLRGG
jgi:ABC-type lipoprotein release transport system permease subunit